MDSWSILALMFLLYMASAMGTRSMDDMIADHNRVLAHFEGGHAKTSFRVRREMDEEFQHETCCGKGKHAMSQIEKDAIKKCNHILHEGGDFKEENEDQQAMMDMFDCYMECVGEVHGTYNKETEKINTEALIEDIAQHYVEDEVKEFVKKVCQLCVKYMSKGAKEHTGKCNPALGHAVMCTLHVVDAKCPPDYQVKSKKCEQLRKRWADAEAKHG